jgi:hypothetical protein
LIVIRKESMRELNACPICGGELIITEVNCSKCKSQIRGKFRQNRFNLFTGEQLYFIEVFLKSEGNIKTVEKELGISYPTVKSKLQKISEILGYTPKDEDRAKLERDKSDERIKLLEKLKSGEADFDETMKRLEELK